MKTQLITIQPQVIQFSRQTVQTIKITNNTSNSLSNFFFCLYNVEKFSFKPQSFSLAPNQHKLIQITLKIKSTKSIAKQFAYLKSTDVNKRLTLLINNFQSPQSRTRQTQEGYSDMNTLSSRDYHQLHNRALNKIIAQQNKFIVGQNSISGRKQFNKTQNFSINSSQKVDLMNFDYLKETQLKNTLLQNQIDELNVVLNQKVFELQKVVHENNFLSEQGNKFLKKLGDKQQRIIELQKLYERIVFENENYSREVKELKSAIQNVKQKQLILKQQQSQKSNSINHLFKNYESRIKQLQILVDSSQRQQVSKFANQFRKKIQQKDVQLKQIRKSLQHQQLLVKQHQINALKFENQRKNLEQNKKKLQIQNKQMQQLNNNLREQIYVYKSKIEENSNSRIHQYLQIALQSYKNENQNLKKSKLELQKSLQSIVNTSRQNESQKKFLEGKIETLYKQLNNLREQLLKYEENKHEIKNQHKRQIREITEKNILLLQKLTTQNNTRRQQQIQLFQKQNQLLGIEIQKYQKEMKEKELQLQKMKQQINTSTERQLEKIKSLQQQNKKLQQKVKKYKKETKKQLKSINDNAFDELKRIHEEKKELTKKVTALEKTLSEIQTVNQNTKNNQNNSRSRSQIQPTRKVGIHNQRDRLLQDSRSYSNQNFNVHNNPISLNSPQNFELYELKEFSQFFFNQFHRFQYLFNLHQQLADPLDSFGRPIQKIKPLYKIIKFFKIIQNKLKDLQQKANQSIIVNKQNQFIKQKLSQIQNQSINKNQNFEQKDENKKDTTLLTVNQQKQVIDQGPSFLMNRSNLSNLNTFQIIQFMKQQMKKQYNKQKEAAKFSEDKYEILKKKIYRQYRTRIIALINASKSTNPRQKANSALVVNKIENLIERFIQSLSNVTHKEAVLNKQIKIKNNVKQENSRLKQKINQLQHLLSQKHKGYCNRDPVKVFSCSTFLGNHNFKEEDWVQSIKLSTQLLTQKAQNQRLNEQLQIVREDYNDLKLQLDELLSNNQIKDSEIIKLKKNQMDLEKEYEKELQKQNYILEDTKNKMTSGSTKSKTKLSLKQKEKFKQRQRQVEILRDELQKKSNMIKTYKQKQKKWQQFMLETNQMQEKQKNFSNSYKRLEESHAMTRQNNRELRQENSELKEIVEKLQKELDRKKLYIKNLKAEDEQSRITKPLRINESVQQIKKFQEALETANQEIFKIKKQKEKEIVKLQSQLNSAKNQALIHIKSLQSVVRATIQTIRKLFASLKILIKRKGLTARIKNVQFTVPQNLIQINATQIYQQFQQILEALES